MIQCKECKHWVAEKPNKVWGHCHRETEPTGDWEETAAYCYCHKGEIKTTEQQDIK